MAGEAPPLAPVLDAVVAAPAPIIDAAPPVAPGPPPLVEAPVPVAEPAAAPAAPLHPAEVPSLLEGFGKPEVPAAADAPKPDAAKPADAKPGEVAPEAPKPLDAAPPEKPEWKFELPETLRADEPRMAKFTGILDELLTPKEGETRPQVAQRLVDLHNEAMTTFAEQTLQNQIKAFNDTRGEWAKQVLADERIGGAGHRTAMAAIARMRDLSISDYKPGTPEFQSDLAEMEQFLRTTGAGDHPVYLKQLHRFARFFDEPAQPPPNPRPPPDLGKNPNRRGSLYANSPPTRS